MHEAWIQLQCPECDKHWERNPADLPASGSDFTCHHCRAERLMAEFTKTKRDLELLKQFV